MIGRRATRALSESIEELFSKYKRDFLGDTICVVDIDRLYDFLFDNDYPAWFCNKSRTTFLHSGTRGLKNFVMQLHTGETLESGTAEWDIKQRERLGQRYIKDLAEDILQQGLPEGIRTDDPILELLASLKRSLELDGYVYEGSRLLEPEEDILDIDEETGVLASLYSDLGLSDAETTFHHLRLSEEHYVAERWDDSISNSRKFLESVLSNVVSHHHYLLNGSNPPSDILSRPAQVRGYLEKEGLLDSKEKEAVASVYGLLSKTGGHPYMAGNDQARLLRHLSLTFSQFVLLRLKAFPSHSE